MLILGIRGYLRFWKMKIIRNSKLLSLLFKIIYINIYIYIIIIREALFVMAICHSVITDEKNGEIVYNASSPDELAIINFAKFCGV